MLFWVTAISSIPAACPLRLEDSPSRLVDWVISSCVLHLDNPGQGAFVVFMHLPLTHKPLDNPGGHTELAVGTQRMRARLNHLAASKINTLA